MKIRFSKMAELILFLFSWCRRVILEASEVCEGYDPVSFSDYVRFVAPEQTPKSQKVQLPYFSPRTVYGRRF